MQSVKHHRSSFSSSISKPKEHHENTLYVAQYQPLPVYHAQFYQQYLLLCTDSIHIYNTEQLTLHCQINVKTHKATFIPFTQYLCFADYKDELKRELVFWNYHTHHQHGKVTFNFVIEDIKASRGTISISSLDHLYIIHFPSLKPIYQGFAGNGIRVVFDTSRQGLTLAHSTQKKGEIKIRNFTNIKTNKLLLDLQSRSRVQTFTQVFRERQNSKVSLSSEDGRHQQIKKEIDIKAHNENIAIIRLSPNGYRVVTASIRGSVVRMYSCLKDELISEFRMGYELSLVVDIQFNAEGNQIVCLNDSNYVGLFQARMSQLELLSESSRKGHEIYQQRNPTSFFSFLSFFNRNLSNQFPFAKFKVNINKDQIEDLKERLQSQVSEKRQRNQISEIKEVHESVLEEQLQVNDETPKEETKMEGQQRQVVMQKKLSKPQYLNIQSFQMIIEDNAIYEHEKKLSLTKKPRLSSHHHFKSLKTGPQSLKIKAPSSRSVKSGKKQASIETFGQKERILHIKGIIGFGSDINVCVLQGNYLIQLKYDPFNGGEMVEKSSINLLKHQLFREL